MIEAPPAPRLCSGRALVPAPLRDFTAKTPHARNHRKMPGNQQTQIRHPGPSVVHRLSPNRHRRRPKTTLRLPLPMVPRLAPHKKRKPQEKPRISNCNVSRERYRHRMTEIRWDRSYTFLANFTLLPSATDGGDRGNSSRNRRNLFGLTSNY